jgi:arylsulfatase A-like enzyme
MPKKKPNVVLIFVDNQPADMMGCYGNKEIHTPNLDNLAARGTLFQNAFCPNAMCSPCRASVLTGLMPSQHGVHTWLDDYIMDQWPENWNALEEFETLPELLKGEGYKTSLIGKYHIGIPDKPQNGFDNWLTFGIGHMLSFYDNEVIDNGRRYVVPEHSVDFLTQKAVEYIQDQAANNDDPFFLFLTYNAPYGHWPSVKGAPDNRHAHHYDNCSMNSVPREGLSKELIDWIALRLKKMPGEEEGYYKSLAQIPNDLPTLRNFYSQVSIIDDGVGRINDLLMETGLAEDTLLIYTADHGMSLGEHGFWGHGEDTWPSNTHRQAHNIPLIMSQPGVVNQSHRVENLVGTTDIFATILNHAGVNTESLPASPARDLGPLLRNKTLDSPDHIFMEQEETRAIRTPEWLFMKRIKQDEYKFEDELYDLHNDPGERNNLASAPEHLLIVEALSTEIDKFFEKYSSPQWDLWKGGQVKSNSTRPFLWKEVWGSSWEPTY